MTRNSAQASMPRLGNMEVLSHIAGIHAKRPDGRCLQLGKRKLDSNMNMVSRLFKGVARRLVAFICKVIALTGQTMLREKNHWHSFEQAQNHVHVTLNFTCILGNVTGLKLSGSPPILC